MGIWIWSSHYTKCRTNWNIRKIEKYEKDFKDNLGGFWLLDDIYTNITCISYRVGVFESIRGMKWKACICLNFNKALDITSCGKQWVRWQKVKITKTTKLSRFYLKEGRQQISLILNMLWNAKEIMFLQAYIGNTQVKLKILHTSQEYLKKFYQCCKCKNHYKPRENEGWFHTSTAWILTKLETTSSDNVCSSLLQNKICYFDFQCQFWFCRKLLVQMHTFH